MKNRLKDTYLYGLAFVIPAILLALVYAIRGVYPISNNSVLVLDLNAQYVYYYEAFRDAFLEGKSLFYSFSRTLGGGMMGIYAYYLASPFSFILLLFSQNHITEAILVMILIKVGCAGLTFFIYLKHTRDSHNFSALLFSTLYGLTGYVLVQTMNPMWLDAVLFFPIIIIGLRQIVDEGKYFLYLIFLTLTFISNFYIGYMTGIFIFVYFIYYTFGETDRQVNILKSFFLFGMSTVLSIAMSAWLIIPTYEALKMGKLTFTEPNFFPEQQLKLFDLFAKALPLSYDSVNFHGLPFIYSGLIVLILCGVYFMSDTIRPKKRIASALFIVIFIACFTVSTLDIVLHGFQAPNWLNYRYAYILSFFLISIAYDAYLRLEVIRGKIVLNATLVLVLLVALTDSNDYSFIIPENAIWFSYIGLLIYALLLYGIKCSKGERERLLLHSLLAAMIFLELILNSFQMMNAAHGELRYSTRTSYVNYFEDLYPAVDYIEEIDDGFYRSETLTRRAVNDPMALGIYGLSNSSSILNSDVIEFLYQLGISSKSHWTKYKGTTILSDSLLGIKYVILNVDEEISHDKYEIIYGQEAVEEEHNETDRDENYDESVNEADEEEANIKVSYNPYALPMMFVADHSLSDVLLDSTDPFENQNRLFSAILGEDIAFFKPLDQTDVSYDNVSKKKMKDCMLYKPVDANEDAMIKYTIDTADNNPMYLFLYSEYPRVVDLWKNNEYIDTFFDNNSRCIMPLGVNNKEDEVTIKTVLTEEEYYLSEAMFYYLDMALFEEAIEEIRGNAPIINKINETKIEITVDAKEGKLLFTSIPYEPGWTAKIGNKKANIIKTADALMAIELVEGQQTVVLSYTPSGFIMGAIISLLGLIATIMLFIIKKRRQLKPKVVTIDEQVESIEEKGN